MPHMLRGLVRTGRQQARSAATGDQRGGLADRLAVLSPADQLTLLLDLVRVRSRPCSATPARARCGSTRPSRDAGFDSLTAVELRNRLREATGLKLPATWCSTTRTRRLSRGHLRDELGGVADAAWHRPSWWRTRTSRSRSSAWRAACPVASRARRTCGGWWPGAGTRSSGFPTDRGWDLEKLLRPRPGAPGHLLHAARAASCTRRACSTPGSSASRRARPSRWTRSSACCWRPHGRPWKARALTRPR